ARFKVSVVLEGDPAAARRGANRQPIADAAEGEEECVPQLRRRAVEAVERDGDVARRDGRVGAIARVFELEGVRGVVAARIRLREGVAILDDVAQLVVSGNDQDGPAVE